VVTSKPVSNPSRLIVIEPFKHVAVAGGDRIANALKGVAFGSQTAWRSY
jgi:hypothetical protein